MRQHTFIAFAGAIALAVAGCTSEPEVDTTAASPSPEAVAVAPSPTATPFAKPLVTPKPPPAGAIPGLIQSTNPNQRAQQVQANISSTGGNSNPFADLPPNIPRPTVTTRPGTVPTVSQLPAGARPGGGRSAPLSPAGGTGGRSSATANGTPQGSRTAGGGTSPGSSSIGTPSIAALPPLPVANLANAVEVTGIVRVGGTVQAIVRAPNETTSRYVGVGQRLSGGQVLVKRIEMNAGTDPVVVLEENGIEVAREVGEPAPQQPGRTA